MHWNVHLGDSLKDKAGVAADFAKSKKAPPARWKPLDFGPTAARSRAGEYTRIQCVDLVRRLMLVTHS